ncbi:MAG TPA: hypothetical protein PKC41_03990 [Chitinophagaceae bacterium]|jgi:hypothetical protein|nr:hypothetical protein [Chitinophagaceae bacterium]
MLRNIILLFFFLFNVFLSFSRDLINKECNEIIDELNRKKFIVSSTKILDNNNLEYLQDIVHSPLIVLNQKFPIRGNNSYPNQIIFNGMYRDSKVKYVIYALTHDIDNNGEQLFVIRESNGKIDYIHIPSTRLKKYNIFYFRRMVNLNKKYCSNIYGVK